ncbi:UNVERIFIED_CONTAM: nucleosome assembly protein (nap) protein [Hammondia hammondi]|eukprot:XP_008888746.1 nucleosome assembly protein (nap) protein [Hammondia hammondi]
MAPEEKKGSRNKQLRRKGSGKVTVDGDKLRQMTEAEDDVFGSTNSPTKDEKKGEENAASQLMASASSGSEAVAKPNRTGITLAKRQEAKEDGRRKDDETVQENDDRGKKAGEAVKGKEEGGKKDDDAVKAKDDSGKKEDDVTTAKDNSGKKEDDVTTAKDNSGKKEEEATKEFDEGGKQEDEALLTKERYKKEAGGKEVKADVSEADRAKGESERQMHRAAGASEEAREAYCELQKSISRAQEVESEFRATSEGKSKEELLERMEEAEDALKAARDEAEQKSIAEVKAIETAETAAATAAKRDLEVEVAQSRASAADEASAFQIRVSPPDSSKEKAENSVQEVVFAAMAAVGLGVPGSQEYEKSVEEETARAAAGGNDSVDEGESLAQRKVVAILEKNQERVRLIESQFQEAVTVLREKFDRLMEPIFEERAAILSTESEEETPERGAGDLSGSDKLPVGTRALPGFWLRAFENNSILSSMLGVRDKPLLLYLRNIRRVLNTEKEDGFSLVFEFDENPFFTPCTLTKTFKMKQDEGTYIVSRTVGTPIVWRENMDVTKSAVVRKQRNVRTNNVRTVHEEKHEKSFFSFFRDSVVPEDDELEAMNEEEQSEIFEKLKLEYDAGVTLRDLIIPYALEWYVGSAADTRGSDDDEEPETVQGAKADDAGRRRDGAQQEAGSFASWFGF